MGKNKKTDARKKSISGKIILATWAGIVVLAVVLMLVMYLSMHSLTGDTVLDVLQPTAKTAAQSVETSLHILADRFLLFRERNAFSSKSDLAVKQSNIDNFTSGIEFGWLGLYGTDGILVTGSDDCPRSIAGRGIRSAMQETGRLVIEDTTVGPSGLEVVMGVPTKEAEAVTGYLVGSYKYDVISDALNVINIGQTGTAFIINQEGHFIAHKDAGLLYSQQTVSDILGTGHEASEVIVRMEQGQSGSSALYTPAGHVFFSYAPIRGTRWSLGIVVSQSDFSAPVQQALVASFLVTAILLALFGVVFRMLIGQALSQPLELIAENARRLAQGNFSRSVPKEIEERNDEIGQLGTDFASMSHSLQDVIGDLNQLSHSVQAGRLNERADLSSLQGAYRHIAAGMNNTLDVIISHMDSMPGALALFDEDQKPLYVNRTMAEFLDRHQLSTASAEVLAAFSAGRSLDPAAELLFGPEGQEGDTYKTDVVLQNAQGEEFNYNLTMRRVYATDKSGLDDPVCVILVVSDTTKLTQAKEEAEMASRAKGNFLSKYEP